MVRACATPVLIDRDNLRGQLQRIRLGNGLHDESWLQALIHDHPAILPIAEIEPGFGEPFAAAREVPCGTGFIDNLYLTPSGDIIVVETKLWRNNQMRREVVAQLLDYVAALNALSFDTFEAAVSRGRGAPAKLYDLVRDNPDALDEAAFIDAVSFNLRRGRMLALVVGDGIRTETEALASLLQHRAAAQFTFALIELATWQTAAGEIVAIPSTLAKTVMIERAVIRVEQGIVAVRDPSMEPEPKAQSISSSRFWEEIAKRNPALPETIQSFQDALVPFGIYSDLKASLNLKAEFPERQKPVNFGYIMKNGQFWTQPAASSLPEAIWRPYLQTLATLIGGVVVDEPGNQFVATSGRTGPRIEQFLPQHQAALVAALGQAVKAMRTGEA